MVGGADLVLSVMRGSKSNISPSPNVGDIGGVGRDDESVEVPLLSFRRFSIVSNRLLALAFAAWARMSLSASLFLETVCAVKWTKGRSEEAVASFF